ncbi:MAG: adenylyltransferase/cytidyltransferase family protein [Candidatus Aenigmarchaeota archaeon]|nr:adenylyltransferase/cytidyltransferase family protein [Candidatus Aenigmarchaeota archaeon]
MHMKKAIFIGRFQPLHKGHCHAIKDILQREDIGHLYIIIGSTGKEGTVDNPYSFDTRKDMLKKVFKEQIDKKKISVLGLNDCSSDNEWIINLKSIAPDFDIAFTRNDWTRKCLESVCIVEKQKYYDEKHLNGTYIRERIKNRKDIDDLVYEEVLGTINNKN